MKKYLLFSLILISCTPQNFLISSTFQHWVGGRKETGSGTNYKFKIVAPESDAEFKIKSIHAHHKVLGFSTHPSTFSKGDTLVISAYKTKTVWESDTLCKIGYLFNNKTFNLVPKEMKELEKLLYP
jgi:hypothetical protein